MNTKNRTKFFSILNNHTFSCDKFVIVCFLLIHSSCEDIIQVESPSTQIIGETVFENDATANAAMIAIYSDMCYSSGARNSLTVQCGFLADELMLYLEFGEYRQLHSNAIVPTNSIISEFWNSWYSYIYQANSILEGIQKSSKITQSLKNQLAGEALFIRAFAHFYLTNLYGDIPYITTTDYRSNTVASRAPTEEVYQRIVTDLLAAQELLHSDYSHSAGERVRVNKWAAKALLSRIYLYVGDWKNAEEQASSIIDNKEVFSLTPLDDVFLKNSNEAIWQLKPNAPNMNTWEGNTFILTGPPSFSALQEQLVNGFEHSDTRKTKWINYFTDGTSTWYYPFKYKIRTGSTPLNEYSMILRLAEQHLIRAEARVHQNKLTAAVGDIDLIRQRAELPSITVTNPTYSQTDLLSAIEQERRVELFSEWGHRWFDLKRKGRLDVVLGATKADWSPSDSLLPIPQSEILVNPNMKQNAGYF